MPESKVASIRRFVHRKRWSWSSSTRPQHGHVPSSPIFRFWAPTLSHPYIHLVVRIDRALSRRFLARPSPVKFSAETCVSIQSNFSMRYVKSFGAWAAYWICALISVVTMLFPKKRVAFEPGRGTGRVVGCNPSRKCFFAAVSQSTFSWAIRGKSSYESRSS